MAEKSLYLIWHSSRLKNSLQCPHKLYSPSAPRKFHSWRNSGGSKWYSPLERKERVRDFDVVRSSDRCESVVAGCVDRGVMWLRHHVRLYDFIPNFVNALWRPPVSFDAVEDPELRRSSPWTLMLDMCFRQKRTIELILNYLDIFNSKW